MKLTWSVSRDQMLHGCERKYYFQYLASAKINSRDEMLREIAFLKKLKNLYMWKGSLFHDLIADYLQRLQRGQAIDDDTFLDEYQKIIETQWSHSLKKKYRENIRAMGQGNSLALLEHEYDEELSENTLQGVILDIRNWFLLFTQWENDYGIFEKLRKSSRFWIEPQPYGANAPGFDYDNVQVLAKVDLATQNNDGSFDIYDWKSGATPNQPAWNNLDQAELQVSVYQLWPHKRFNVPLNAIHAHLIYLGNNPPEHKVFEIDSNRKEYFLNLIGTSIERAKQFLELHSGEQLSLRDFDYGTSHLICRLCAFKRLCQRELEI
jgi:hypothetical protein